MLKPLPINGGVNLNVDEKEIKNSQVATDLRNILISASGANVDRPGLKVTPFATTGTSFGIHAMKYFKASGTVVFVDTNRRIWSVTSAGVVTEITGSALGGTSRPVLETDGTFLAIAGGGAPQTWDGVAATTTTMAGSPPDTDFIRYLDGYWILKLIDDQELRIAGPTAPTRLTWNSSDFFQAEGLPDDAKAIAVLLRELYVFGEESTEVFQNVGATNPFVRTFFMERGILAPYSLIQVEDTLAWLDNLRQLNVYQGRSPLQINQVVDREIQRMTTVDDCWAARIYIDGFKLLVFTFPTEERSFCYDLDRKEWSEWDGYADGLPDRLPIHSHFFVPAWNKHLVGDPATGKIYELSFDSKVDGSRVLRRLRRMRYNHGTNQRKRSNYYLIDVKRGLVANDGSTAEPVLTMRVNDDGKGWSEPREVALGYEGEVQTPIRMGSLRGVYRTRELEIQMTDAAEFTLMGIEEDVEAQET
jgi:hypothetical protein